MISKSNQKHVGGIGHSLLSGNGPACASKDWKNTKKISVWTADFWGKF